MKEYVAETGGRYTYSDDILNLQELTLSLSAIFDGCSDFIISGCEIEVPASPRVMSGSAERYAVSTLRRCCLSLLYIRNQPA